MLRALITPPQRVTAPPPPTLQPWLPTLRLRAAWRAHRATGTLLYHMAPDKLIDAFYDNFSSDAASVHRANRALNRHGRVSMSLMMTTYRCGATAAAKDDGEDGYSSGWGEFEEVAAGSVAPPSA